MIYDSLLILTSLTGSSTIIGHSFDRGEKIQLSNWDYHIDKATRIGVFDESTISRPEKSKTYMDGDIACVVLRDMKNKDGNIIANEILKGNKKKWIRV